MKRGPKRAAKPAHAAPTIPPHIAALEIVKSVRPDGSYVCIHDLELTECDECAPIALLADEEASGPAAPTIAIEFEPPAPDAPDAPPVVAFASDRTVGTLDEMRTEYQIHAEFPAPEVRPVLVFDESLSVACAALGLAGEHVRKYTPLDADRFRILTHGGTSITWPDDRDKYTAQPLTQAQKDGVVTSTAHVVDSLCKASEAARKLGAEPRK